MEIAQTAAAEIDSSELFVGMSTDTADMVIEAHGSAFTVAEAMRSCPPFRQMAEAMLEVPGGEEVFKLAVHKMAETAITPIDHAKKNY